MTTEEKELWQQSVHTYKEIAKLYYTTYNKPYVKESLDWVYYPIFSFLDKHKRRIKSTDEFIKNICFIPSQLTDDVQFLTELHEFKDKLRIHLDLTNKQYWCPLTNTALLMSGNYNHKPSYTCYTNPFVGLHVTRLSITHIQMHVKDSFPYSIDIEKDMYVEYKHISGNMRFMTSGGTHVFLDDYKNKRYVLLEELNDNNRKE